jgi:two-component SAPR family response regulator
MVKENKGPNKSTPFIFISAYTDESPIRDVEILTKPVRLNDIKKAMESALVKNTAPKNMPLN